MDIVTSISEAIIIVSLIGIFVSCVINICFSLYRVIATKYMHNPFSGYFLENARSMQMFLLIAIVFFIASLLIGAVLRLVISLFVH